MNRLILSLTCLLTLTFTNCDDNSNTISSGESAVVKINEVVTFKDGRSKFDIECTKLVEDSRCPEFANCIWAGRVVVQITIDGEEWMDLGLGDLTTGTAEPYSIKGKYKDHTIALISAEYGMESNQGIAEKYSIKLKVD